MYLQSSSRDFKGERPLAKYPRGGPCGGFTLLEILMTLAILAVLATLVYSSFDASVRAMEQVDREVEPYRQVRTILSRMSEEISMAYWTDRNTRPDPVFVGRDGVMEGQPWDSLRFTSLSHFRYLEDEAASDLTLLEYELAASPEGQTVLLHRSSPNLYRFLEDSDERFILGEGISGLNLRYFDGREWVNLWEAADRKGLPEGVEIEVYFLGTDSEVKSVKTWVMVPMAVKKGGS